MKRIIGAAVVAALSIFASSAGAQAPPQPVLQQAPVFGSFYLGARSLDLSATTVSSRVALGASAPVAYVCNTGSSNAYVRLGTVSITATAANGTMIIAGQCVNLYSTGSTHIAGITASSTTTLQIASGWGATFGSGGGSSGGGSGGSVTQGTVPWVVSNAGTFATQAAQSGTWTVQPGNTANTTAWLVTGTGGTFPVTNTGTFATQSAVTAASGAVASGAFASGSLAAGSMVDLLTMRGTKAPGTAAANSELVGCVYTAAGVTLTDGQQAACQMNSAGAVLVQGVGVAIGSTTSGQTGSLVMGATTTAAPTYTTAQTNPISLQTDGSQRVAVTNTVAITANSAVNVAQINGVTPLMGAGNTGTGSPRVTLPTDQVAIATWGQGANAATAPTSSTQEGCRAASTAPTEVTDGQLVAVQCSLGGKQVILPYTVKELAVRGNASATNTAATTVLAAGSGSNKTYITGIQCANSSATSVTVTFNDVIGTGTASTLYLPATGGNNGTFNVPLVTAAATAFTFASSSSVSTVTCNAQGYYAL